MSLLLVMVLGNWLYRLRQDITTSCMTLAYFLGSSLNIHICSPFLILRCVSWRMSNKLCFMYIILFSLVCSESTLGVSSCPTQRLHLQYRDHIIFLGNYNWTMTSPFLFFPFNFLFCLNLFLFVKCCVVITFNFY